MFRRSPVEWLDVCSVTFVSKALVTSAVSDISSMKGMKLREKKWD